ncbi:Lipoyltransferase and lipoate-protein ligase [Basidiobolus meristosporus CBS 931.73]|uniref:Putative lipoate-protein ligase A n=1 Tax=Basidiobolus meristosporus CBS 931.73 TaxID=1314790 RepID=A0A1Y1YYT1_9FUNG|nr:Lipoyltransferase and lipoate-protein ligase [Basidiobolus meristosporus CBS 931.73]|eukprot:ORY03182.1 Lipoyltransferase and lipoate-protein ligase [Basidiobolus meristosporus CBS 931.73]
MNSLLNARVSLGRLGLASTKRAVRQKHKLALYTSRLNDTKTNLAFEEWLFRDTDPEMYILYLWRNRSCVVIGRNQNPWKECNIPLMRELGIPLIRRQSGGGAVYQDMGNSCYTILMPKEVFNRRTSAELVTRALLDCDIPAYVNERSDITVDGFKVSGSAYKLTNRRAYHHGTMLIDTELSNLSGCLRSNKEYMTTKGVESVRSKVTNLRPYSYTIDHQMFSEAVAKEFCNHYGVEKLEPTIMDDDFIRKHPKIQEYKNNIDTWEWIYGQTPEFTVDTTHVIHQEKVKLFLRSKGGLILDAQITQPVNRAYVDAMCNSLKGARYEPQSIAAAFARISGEVPLEDYEFAVQLHNWLKQIL